MIYYEKGKCKDSNVDDIIGGDRAGVADLFQVFDSTSAAVDSFRRE